MEKAPNRLTSLGGTWSYMVADEENIGKASKESPSPGGTWAEMVEHSIINLKHTSPSQSSSQEKQETTDLGPSQATQGRRSQRKQQEQDVERELELGRKLIIEDTKLLQNVKYSGTKDFRSLAGSHAFKK